MKVPCPLLTHDFAQSDFFLPRLTSPQILFCPFSHYAFFVFQFDHHFHRDDYVNLSDKVKSHYWLNFLKTYLSLYINLSPVHVVTLHFLINVSVFLVECKLQEYSDLIFLTFLFPMLNISV